MAFSFEPEDAMNYGVNEAIFLQNMKYWIFHNHANQKHFYEVDSATYPELAGERRYFTYNSAKAFAEHFPFWTEKQIRTIIENLEKKKVILTGNYNETKYDRTKWYGFYFKVTFKDGKCNLPNGKMEVPNVVNGSSQKGEPIPDNNTDNKPDTNNLSSKLIVSAADRPSAATAAAQALFSLEKEYEKVDPNKKEEVYSFIKENCPCFINPYVDYWNLFAKPRNFPEVQVINDSRKKKFAARIRDKNFNFLKIIYKANQGDFIMNTIGKWFSFDWLLENETNYLKVIEGNYENREKIKQNAKQLTDQQQLQRQKAEQRTAELINQR